MMSTRREDPHQGYSGLKIHSENQILMVCFESQPKGAWTHLRLSLAPRGAPPDPGRCFQNTDQRRATRKSPPAFATPQILSREPQVGLSQSILQPDRPAWPPAVGYGAPAVPCPWQRAGTGPSTGLLLASLGQAAPCGGCPGKRHRQARVAGWHPRSSSCHHALGTL